MTAPLENNLKTAAIRDHAAPTAVGRRPVRSKHLALLCMLPFALFFLVFQIAPLLWVTINSLNTPNGWGLANFQKIFGSKFYLQAIKHSLQIAFWSSLFGIVIAILGSYSLRQVDSRLRDFVMAFSNMTSNFAGVPLAFAFVILLGFNGALTILLKQAGIIDDFNLYSKTGLIVLYTYFQIPLGVLLLYPAFDALREDWRESSALLDPNMASALAMVLVGLMAAITVAHQLLLRRSYHASR